MRNQNAIEIATETATAIVAGITTVIATEIMTAIATAAEIVAVGDHAAGRIPEAMTLGAAAVPPRGPRRDGAGNAKQPRCGMSLRRWRV